MIPDHANPSRQPQHLGEPNLIPGAKRACNRHTDCNAADAEAVLRTGRFEASASHCHDDCCEDCFGQ